MAPPATGATGVVSNREEDSMNQEASMSGKVLSGIIYPPPDIRTIVDKTATFVARNGVDFEQKIKDKEANNPRFNFLKPNDPYNAYYVHKVRELSTDAATAQPRAVLPDAVRAAVELANQIPTRPPPALEFVAEPASIDALDLDLLRLTALFVARNGRQFLTQLMSREARNAQFDFLKPQHSNFPYFTKLVEQYTKIIVPSASVVDDLRHELTDKKKLMEDVTYRVAWEKHQRQIRAKEQADLEKERLEYSRIDWHDFVVVQTVEFPINETAILPGLCTPKDVGARILAEQREETMRRAQAMVMAAQQNQNEQDSMEVEESDEEEEQVRPPPPSSIPAPPAAAAPTITPSLNPVPSNLIIRDYKKPSGPGPQKRTNEDYVVWPATGERVPVDKLQSHGRYNMIDSQYKEERDRQLLQKSNEEPVFAPGVDIGHNLSRFAERRTDIFGVGSAGAEQTMIGRKLGEEEAPQQANKDRVIWDGTVDTIDATTRAAQRNLTLEQQISEIHRQHGMVADAGKERIGPQDGQPPAKRPHN